MAGTTARILTSSDINRLFTPKGYQSIWIYVYIYIHIQVCVPFSILLFPLLCLIFSFGFACYFSVHHFCCYMSRRMNSDALMF